MTMERQRQRERGRERERERERERGMDRVQTHGNLKTPKNKKN
jgi:hypothetical protein